MRSPKLRIWMLLLIVGILAFVIAGVVEVQRRRERIRTLKALELAKRTYLAKYTCYTDEELKWIKEAEMWEVLAGPPSPISKDPIIRRIETHAQGRMKWCRLMASRAGDLKRKYAHALAHPADLVIPDPPEPIEAYPISLIRDLIQEPPREPRAVDWRKTGFPPETNWDVLFPLGKPRGARKR